MKRAPRNNPGSKSAASNTQATHAQAQLNEGLALHQKGLLAQAKTRYEQALAIQPGYCDALHLLGLIAYQWKNYLLAVELMGQAMVMSSHNAALYCAHGKALRELNRLDEAVASFDRAISIQPEFAEAHSNRGNVLVDLLRIEDAMASYDRAISIKPDYALAYYNRGNALHLLARFDEAVASYDRSITIQADFAEAHSNRGVALAELKRLDEAIASFEIAVGIKADYAEAYNHRGNALQELRRFEDAMASHDQALSIKPDLAEAHSSRGNALQALRRQVEALASYKRAIESNPDLLKAHSNLLFVMQFGGLHSLPEIKSEHERFAAQFEAPLRSAWRGHANKPDPGRRLNIGYVSPDFRSHAVANFIEPVLANHDKGQFNISCYYCHWPHDEVTDRLAGYADHWLDCKSMTDEQLSERIRMDGIDILVDLAGHTGNNRILAFARKPAPIQMTYLGYPGSSGLSAMDYRLTDANADPEGSEAHYTEKLLRMPDSLWCYRPLYGMPEITPLPALKNGYVTFGSFNNFNKIDSACLALWAQLLQEIPLSRLLMATVPEGESRLRLTGQFAALGIANERLEFHGMLPGMAFHRMLQRADISLDPISVNGATTTCESLWLGVPVISLAGTRFLERAGLSILSAAGLPELAASTPQHYIEIAKWFAENLPQLEELRASLRQRLAVSPMADQAGFTRNLENLYRDAWRTWCGTTATAAI